MPTMKVSPVTEAEVTQPHAPTEKVVKALKVPKFKCAFITPELCESVSATSADIITRLNDLSKGEVEVGSAMLKLKNEFNKYAETNSLTEDNIKQAFNEYVQVVFGFQTARTYEYMKVAQHEIVSKMRLSISSLVELSRLSPEVLKIILEKKDEAELKKLSYREMKAFVKSNNKKALKKTKKSKLENTTTEILAAPAPLEDMVEKFTASVASSDTVVALKSAETPESEPLSELELAIAQFRQAFEHLQYVCETVPTTDEVDELTVLIVEWQTKMYQARKKAA